MRCAPGIYPEKGKNSHDFTPFHFEQCRLTRPAKLWNWFHTLMEQFPQVKGTFQEKVMPAIWILDWSAGGVCAWSERGEKSPAIPRKIDFRAVQVDRGCARLHRAGRSDLAVVWSAERKKYGSSSTENHDSRRSPRRRCWRGNDFARAQFQFASQPGDARARNESDPAPGISSECASSPHFAEAFGDSLLSA